MKELYEIEQIITSMMESDRELCNADDMTLYCEFAMNVNPVIKGMGFDTVMRNRVALGLPAMSSVSRAKRKIHEKRTDLRPNARTEKALLERTEEFIDYARKV